MADGHRAAAAKIIPIMTSVISDADDLLLTMTAAFETLRSPSTDVATSRSLADLADGATGRMEKLLAKVPKEAKDTNPAWPAEWATASLPGGASQLADRFNREIRNRAKIVAAMAEAMETIARVREEEAKAQTTFAEDATKCMSALSASEFQ